MNNFIKHINADNIQYTGSGVKVAVIDTGYDIAKGNADVTASYAVGGGSVQDLIGHGTLVSNLIAHNEVGLAPDVELYTINADGDGDGRFSFFDLIESIEWAIEQEVDIINMSLSAAGLRPLQELVDVIDLATSSGIEVVAATGNSHPLFIGPPASIDGVHGIGASTFDDHRAEFSQLAGGLDLYSPGVRLDLVGLDDIETIASGTSFSSPTVAASMAILMEAGISIDRLYETTTPIEDYSTSPNGGLINLGFALNVTDDPMLHHWTGDDTLSVSYMIPEQLVTYDVAVYISKGDVIFDLDSNGGIILADDNDHEISFHNLSEGNELVGNLYGVRGIYDLFDTSNIEEGEYIFHVELINSETNVTIQDIAMETVLIL